MWYMYQYTCMEVVGGVCAGTDVNVVSYNSLTGISIQVVTYS